MSSATAFIPRSPRHLAAPASAAPAPWTGLQISLSVMLLTYVWRVQDIVLLLGKLQITSLATIAALGFFFLGGASRAEARLRTPVLRMVVVILLLACLSVPGGVYPGWSFRFIIEDHVKTVVFAVMLAASIRSVRDVERYAVVHAAGAAVYCFTVLTRFQVQADGRLGGLFYYDANDLAMVLVCTFPLLVYLARPGPRTLLRLAVLPVMAMFVVTIVRTGSRGGFLGLLAVFAALLVGFTAVPRAHRIASVALVGLCLTVAGNELFWGRLQTLLNPSEDYNWAGNSSGGRVEVWKRGVGYMLQRPLLGVGASAFGIAEGSISEMAALHEVTGKGYKWSAAHNSFVQIGAELGFPGLIAFVAMLYFAFRLTRRLARDRASPRAPPEAVALGQVFFATLVGYTVTGFFLSQAFSAYLYSILGIVVGLEAAAAGAVHAAPPPAAVPTTPRGRGGLIVARPHPVAGD